MTHEELVQRAGRWLRNSARIKAPIEGHKHLGVIRCGVVFTELVTWESETPDAIGWFNGGRGSILIEVKVSRADFRADANKVFREFPATGVGLYRYYMTPAGLLTPDELPDRWGLLEAKGRSVSVVRAPERFPEYTISGEKCMMYSGLRRLQTPTTIP
jgi:hypothetical protein